MILYILTLVGLMIGDGIWLTLTSSFYKSSLSNLFTFSISLSPILVFYPLYALGVLYFVLDPALKGGHTILSVAMSGALFGLVAYSVYDLTNKATIKGWPLSITIIDMVWGMCLTSVVSILVFIVVQHSAVA
jgi:uncharacterized membrane protein